MTEDEESGEILVLDSYIVGPWYKIFLITETELLAATMKSKWQQEVLDQLNQGYDPFEVLQGHSPLENPVRRTPLADIQALEWSEGFFGQIAFKGTSSLKVHYYDTIKQKNRRFNLRFNAVDRRNAFARKLKFHTGDWDEIQAPLPAWRCGIPALIFLLFFGVILSFRAAYRFLTYGPRLSDVMEDLGANFLPALQFAYGDEIYLLAVILIPSLIWWAITCVKRPTRTVARPVNPGF